MGNYALGTAINSFMEGAMDFLKLYYEFQKMKHQDEFNKEQIELAKRRLEQTGEYQQGLLENQQKKIELLKRQEQFKEMQWKENEFDRNVKLKAQLDLYKLQQENAKLEKRLKGLRLRNQDKINQTSLERAKIELENAKLKNLIYINKLAQAQKTNDIEKFQKIKDSALKDWQAYYKALVTYLKPIGGQAILSDDFDIQDTPKLFDLYNEAIKSPNLTSEQKTLLKSTFEGLKTAYYAYKAAQNKYSNKVLGNTGNIFQRRGQMINQSMQTTSTTQQAIQTPISSAYSNTP